MAALRQTGLQVAAASASANGTTRSRPASSAAGRDGLPVVPPTDERILRMLAAPRASPDEIVGEVPPNLAPITVEKVAINAVMAGCKPEYLPVVLAALEAALEPEFTMHGLLCTTCFSGPIIVVNGPIAREIGMNSRHQLPGPGQPRQRHHRPRAAADRAQRRRRPAGRTRPRRAGRSRQVHVLLRRGRERSDLDAAVGRARHCAGQDAVTLFQGDGIQGFIDQRSRTPEELTRSLAMSLLAVGHPKLCEFTNAMLVLVPGALRDLSRGRLGPRAHHARAARGAAAARPRTSSRARRASARASTRSAPRTRWSTSSGPTAC